MVHRYTFDDQVSCSLLLFSLVGVQPTTTRGFLLLTLPLFFLFWILCPCSLRNTSSCWTWLTSCPLILEPAATRASPCIPPPAPSQGTLSLSLFLPSGAPFLPLIVPSWSRWIENVGGYSGRFGGYFLYFSAKFNRAVDATQSGTWTTGKVAFSLPLPLLDFSSPTVHGRDVVCFLLCGFVSD